MDPAPLARQQLLVVICELKDLNWDKNPGEIGMALSQIPKSAPEKTTKLEKRPKRSRLCSRHPYIHSKCCLKSLEIRFKDN
jgi:hypothetical protein